jgi:hypothetical protein
VVWFGVVDRVVCGPTEPNPGIVQVKLTGVRPEVQLAVRAISVPAVMPLPWVVELPEIEQLPGVSAGGVTVPPPQLKVLVLLLKERGCPLGQSGIDNVTVSAWAAGNAAIIIK